MRALIIDHDVRVNIERAREKARMKTVPWEKLREFAHPMTKEMRLADKAKMPGIEKIIGRSEHVLIPHGFRASISYEQQPAGIIRHLSISVDTKGNLPSVPAVDMLLVEFGFDPLSNNTSHIWLEEFEPGHQAVNIAQLEAEMPAGHA